MIYLRDMAASLNQSVFTRNWESLEASLGYPLATKSNDKPLKLNEMIEVAEKLSQPFGLVRVDLYYDEAT